jgi:hypothetical protein
LRRGFRERTRREAMNSKVETYVARALFLLALLAGAVAAVAA